MHKIKSFNRTHLTIARNVPSLKELHKNSDMQFRVKFSSELYALLEVRTLLVSTFCMSPSGFSWILKLQVRSPTTSPQAGLYITKPSRWIYSSSLHLRPYFSILSVTNTCMYIYMSGNERKEQHSLSTR